ncbi:MAG: TlpA family protein disulfide reductase, partial [Deltaproteobacteria bacterium]|nr:TlpA family protein disulfide reductase [Deltaproteobacteria bacterium]MBW2535579.1 TlpA family protein disulfide reductase [Deltaproteobacteria bacterium]
EAVAVSGEQVPYGVGATAGVQGGGLHEKRASAAAADPPPVAEPPSAPEPGQQPSAVIAPGRIVPSFSVRSIAGERFESSELVGKRPFVVVLFASWCGVCHLKIPLVQKVLDEVGDGIVTIGVALDDGDSWDEVGPFVDRYSLTFPIVRGEHFQRFALAYGPTGGVPAVAVIAADGRPVEYQLGIAPNHPLDLAVAVLYVNEQAARASQPQPAPLLR